MRAPRNADCTAQGMLSALRRGCLFLASGSLSLASLALSACVAVQPMTVNDARSVESHGVSARTIGVSASQAFLAQHGGGSAVIATTATLENRGDGSVTVDLARTTLVITDPAGKLGSRSAAATSGGVGPAPDAVRLDRLPPSVDLRPQETVTVWLAFQLREPLDEPDIPRSFNVTIPLANGGTLDVPLSDPATGRPRWVLPAVRHAGYAGVSVIGNFDEASVGILRTASKSVAGPVVLGPSVALGVRGGGVRGERERTIVCCDLAVSFDVSLPVRMGRVGSFGPYLAYHSVFALESGRIDKATWHGPAAGLQFFTRLIEPNVPHALPVSRSPTLLGYSAFTVAYAHLFRRGDAGGSPGMLLLFEHTLPEL